jgi:DNA-binding NtrC family response regulator
MSPQQVLALDGPPFETKNPAMARVLAMAQRVGPSDTSILLLGETGVGKEWMARAIHAASPRAQGPLVAVNCAALPAQLLESELFGHEAGAFTGAIKARRGYFELAAGGTLLLDEIAEMSTHLQAKLLRALQEHSIQRLGGEREVRLDVRVIASTNRDLETAMTAGQFRRDLYYRLAVVTLTLPPLRERAEDIPVLARHYFEHFRASLRRTDLRDVDTTALAALVAYPWPGNVRELINVMERAVLLSSGPAIGCDDLPVEVADLERQASRRQTDRQRAGDTDPLAIADLLREPLLRASREVQTRFEREYLVNLLTQTAGHVGRAAERAGIDPRTLYNKMREHGLDKSEFRKPRD